MALAPSIWPPVDPAKGEFRILVLDDYDDPDEAISGHLQIASVHDNAVYDAISYAWADAGDFRTIYINGQQHAVASTLTINMRHCQIKTGTKAFWCDAISINQLDNDEKSQQIQIMHHIFAGARIVRVFFNPDSSYSPYVERAVDVLLQTVEHSDLQAAEIDGQPMNATHIEWLSGLRHDAWWTRVWVVQEFVLAKELVFQFRDKFFDVEVLNKPKIRQLPLALSMFQVGESRLSTELLQKCCRSFAQGVNNLLWYRNFPLDRRHGLEEKHMSLLTNILFEIRRRHVTNPKDRIFGILALVNRILGSSLIEPDYTKELRDIFALFTFELIEKSRSLIWLLQCHHTTNSLIGLPSWVPDYSSRYNFEVEQGRAEFLIWSRFDASLGSVASAKLLQHSNTLSLRGVLVDTVAHVGHFHDRRAGARYLWHLQALMRWEALCREVFDRIESADYICGNQTVWKAYCKAVTGRLSKPDFSYDPELKYKYCTAEFGAHQDKIADHDGNNRVFEQVLKTIARRCLAITNKGYICLAPPSTKEGDAVYILAGGKGPFVLRPVCPDEKVRLPSQNSYNPFHMAVGYKSKLTSTQCRLIGDCYVEGVMKGEFIKDHGLGLDDFEDVVLV
ncbi:hypothetical protein PV08_04591 [Exophiala spinifera]|uniref:Heterokaryon incompatibility domain-containing protein n=1 Tax=Exophiala spinifera TaxID=91928 RepID=A0A0D1ZXJ6_9EURO|nr:uncharacterized protein PV08_04591 [Exophiala spinifera]KIW17397.1 hypothetical protein PV08_04591 [Exophiala spinifera]